MGAIGRYGGQSTWRALKTALKTGAGRGPLTKEIVACMALIAEIEAGR